VAFPPAVRSVLSDDVELAGPEVRLELRSVAELIAYA
jgi:hypothetical protein